MLPYEIIAKTMIDINTADISQIMQLPGIGSSSIPFLNCVLPSVAVISCGKNNPFGHPKKEVVDRISSIGTTIYSEILINSIDRNNVFVVYLWWLKGDIYADIKNDQQK